MFAETQKEKACATALKSMALYMQQVAMDPTVTIDEKMKYLQWVYKKIPEVNRLLIQIKTEKLNGSK